MFCECAGSEERFDCIASIMEEAVEAVVHGLSNGVLSPAESRKIKYTAEVIMQEVLLGLVENLCEEIC